MANPADPAASTSLPARPGSGRVLRWEYSLRSAGFSFSLRVLHLEPEPEEVVGSEAIGPATGALVTSGQRSLPPVGVEEGSGG